MTISKQIQEILTPDQVIELLKVGNERFVKDELANIKTKHVLEATKSGQHPIAAVLACMDSRVPVERVFDKTIGELFAFRTPGNVINTDTIGGMEYAAKISGTKLFVVMGHTRCGAVLAAVEGTELGNLTSSLNKIKPAIEKVSRLQKGDITDLEFMNNVIINNAINSIDQIRSQSEILRIMEEEGDIKIVPALYDIVTGKVDFL